MEHLSRFLLKYQNFGLNERLSKEVLIESINEVLKKPILGSGDISLNGDVAKIRAPGLVKSEIALNKNKILNLAKEKAGQIFKIKNLR